MTVGPHSTKLPQPWDTRSDQPGVPFCTERSLPKKVFLWSECQQFEGQWLRGVRCFEAMRVDFQHMLVSFISCFPVHVGEIQVILFARLVI